ncbi:MAG TPA: Ig-like domain-containing protein [Candidatus Limnocylindrales bacterium]|jgi:hypothetical protein
MRRIVSLASVVVAVALLGVVLYTATFVDRQPPSIRRVSLSATAGNDHVGQTLTAIDLEFSKRVAPGTVEPRFHIDPYVAGSISWDGVTAIFTPSERLPRDTEFTVSIEPGFEDLAGNVAATGLTARSFKTVGPPAVVGTDPVDGATGRPVDTVISLRFDRLMDTTSVESALGVDPPASSRPTWSGDTLTIAFDQPLRFGTTYAVTVGSRATDTDGNRLGSPFTLRFSTVAAGVGVLDTIPQAGVAGISVRSPITIVFDGPIDSGSASDALSITPTVAGALRVIDLPDDSAITPTASETTGISAGRVLVFTPAAPLAAYTTYTVTLASVVARRGDPSQVAAGRTWRFTTGQPTTLAQNQIAFLSARSGVRNLWLMNPDGSNPRQLTSELVPVSGFDTTADGSTVAYSAGGIVRVMNIDGSDAHPVTADGTFEYAPRFTPDGRSILVGRRDSVGDDLGYWIVPISGSTAAQRQVLANGAPPAGSVGLVGDGIMASDGSSAWAPRAAFEPTGRWLLLATGAGDVRLVDLGVRPDGAAPQVTTTSLVADAAPIWLPANEAFALVARQTGSQTSGLWTIGPDAPATLRATAVGSVAVAPDGMLATLVRTSGSPSRIATLQLGDEAVSRPLTPDTVRDDRWPAFSPDGASILFGRVFIDQANASAGIWTVQVRTGSVAQLSTDGTEPRWLP